MRLPCEAEGVMDIFAAADLKNPDISILKHQNQGIETSQVIEELLALASAIHEATQRGEERGLSEKKIAFSDALQVNAWAVKVFGDPTRKLIAQELVRAEESSLTIDCTPPLQKPAPFAR
jgi:type I site-specific restriction-modification system R (restriction) subunit